MRMREDGTGLRCTQRLLRRANLMVFGDSPGTQAHPGSSFPVANSPLPTPHSLSGGRWDSNAEPCPRRSGCSAASQAMRSKAARVACSFASARAVRSEWTGRADACTLEALGLASASTMRLA